MDFLTSKEYTTLQGERRAVEDSIDADKFMFKRKLEGDYGKRMMEELEHPRKKSFIVGLKYRYARWKTIRDGKRQAKKLKKGGI